MFTRHCRFNGGYAAFPGAQTLELRPPADGDGLPVVYALTADRRMRFSHLKEHAPDAPSGEDVIEQLRLSWPTRIRAVLAWNAGTRLAWLLEDDEFRRLFRTNRIKVITEACVNRPPCNRRCTRETKPDRPILRSVQTFAGDDSDHAIRYHAFDSLPALREFITARAETRVNRRFAVELDLPWKKRVRRGRLELVVPLVIDGDLAELPIELDRGQRRAFEASPSDFLRRHDVKFVSEGATGIRSRFIRRS